MKHTSLSQRFWAPSVLVVGVSVLGWGTVGCDGGGTDVCRGIDCSQHGRCVASADGPRCECDTGYFPLGIACQPDPCAQRTCVHGSCRPAYGLCECNAGWAGESCEGCAPGYHLDSGGCVPDYPCSQLHCIHGQCRADTGTEACDCDPGYAGTYCEACAPGYHAEGLVCVPDPMDVCHPNPCTAEHRTVCVPTSSGYRCDCDTGYRLEGDTCVPETAGPCSPNPCTEFGRTTCTPTGSSGYTCSCSSGWHEVAGTCVPVCTSGTALCAAATTSATELVSSNGHGAVGYSVTDKKAHALLEHLYKNWDDGVFTRDILYDSYLGIRTATASLWLNTVAPEFVEYLEQTNIIHTVHHVGSIRVDSYFYAPFELSRPALVLIGRVTNEGSSSAQVSLYTLHNYHLGYTSSDPVNPDAQTERIQYQSSTGAFLETGVGGALVHRPLGTATHHGCTPNNPWVAVNNGQDLVDTDDSGVGNDRVAGFQKDFSLNPGESGWFGAVSAFERNASLSAQLQADVENVYSGKSADAVLEAALAGWRAWRAPLPPGLSDHEAWVLRHAEAVLRQGQVLEGTDKSYGQIVASLPPGQWNIAWVRDMAYAIVALAKLGHHAEARAALEFMLKAESSRFEAYVGAPYQVSMCRYYGKGKEESDINSDGPNIEFDGFGLFLWAASKYVAASGDSTLLATYWPLIRDKVGNVLVNLVDTTGLIKADSSIWEVHWNGKQKHYAFTSLAAAHGLCRASALAQLRGDSDTATSWKNTGTAIRNALKTHMVDASNVLASSYEELQAGAGYHDVASVEAVGFGLFTPGGAIATATLASFDTSLKVASGRGYFRNDDGGWYDSQEWVWADLRVAAARLARGETTLAEDLIGWISAQALANYGMIAELHHPQSGAYEGEVPMVGYGAGAYILALLSRGASSQPVCGSWEQ